MLVLLRAEGGAGIKRSLTVLREAAGAVPPPKGAPAHRTARSKDLLTAAILQASIQQL